MAARFRPLSLLLVAALLTTACATTPSIRAADGSQNVASGSQAETAVSPPAAPSMSRSAAVDQLVADAFLPASTAGCVIDAIFAQAGVYNPNDPAAKKLDQSAIVNACTGNQGAVASTNDEEAAYTPQVDTPAATASISVADIPPFELTAASMPAINPGGRAQGEVNIAGTTIQYATITPPGFKIGDAAPVFFALPPGGQDLKIATAVADVVYLQQAAARGWVVVTPASPSGRWYRSDTASLVPYFLSWVNAWVDVEGGKPHVGGMSNGGLSAFSFAARFPGEFQSLIAYPGYLRGEDRSNMANLVGMPVRIWVGGDDTSWASSAEKTAKALRELGGDVEVFVLPGEPHVLESTVNGVAFFEALDAARQS